MSIMKILEITAKKAPIPTIAGLIIYFVVPEILDSNQNETILILISVSTFIFVLALLVFGANKKIPQSISGNTISNIETETGDVFNGSKGREAQEEIINNNRIQNVKAKTGDVFNGKKNESKF